MPATQKLNKIPPQWSGLNNPQSMYVIGHTHLVSYVYYLYDIQLCSHRCMLSFLPIDLLQREYRGGIWSDMNDVS